MLVGKAGSIVYENEKRGNSLSITMHVLNSLHERME